MINKGQTNKPKTIRNDGFPETLRNLGAGVVQSTKDDLFSPLPEDILNQIGMRNRGKTDMPSFSELDLLSEKENWQQKARRAEFQRREEKMLFSARERETKARIETLITEVKKLSGAVQTLEKAVAVTAFEAPVNPGVYHVNFFEKLISFLHSLTMRVENATNWIATAGQKKRKHNYYWGQVKKSGTSFMLSSERYVATQVG